MFLCVLAQMREISYNVCFSYKTKTFFLKEMQTYAFICALETYNTIVQNFSIFEANRQIRFLTDFLTTLVA